jgi:hypothetical protein
MCPVEAFVSPTEVGRTRTIADVTSTVDIEPIVARLFFMQPTGGDKERELLMADYKNDTITKLKTMTLDEVVDFTAAQQPDHWTHSAGMAEISRRQTDWQIKAAQAQIEASQAEKEAAAAAAAAAQAEAEAAKASIKTAEATQLSATHMRRSVMVALGSLAFACVAALASSVQSYVSWQGRNDLLRSALETAAINACGEGRALALENGSISVLSQSSVSAMLPLSEQAEISLKAGTAFFGFFNKSYIALQMSRALKISGVDEVAAEYEILVKKYIEVNSRTNPKDPQQVDKATNELMKAIAAFTPALTKLCNTVTTKMGSVN